MIDWYYHDPGEGRVGPYSAEELRKRFRDRRIERDTLVWHAGLREWQPAQRMAEELGLDQVRPDASAPPPLPAGAAIAAQASHPDITARAAARGKYARQPLAKKKTLPSGVIVAIVAVALGVPLLAIVGSVMLSSYQDYARRAQTIGAISGLSQSLQRSVADYALAAGTCPSDRNPRVKQMAAQIRELASVDARFAPIEGGCMFELALMAEGQALHGKHVRFEGRRSGNAFAWSCRGGDLPDAYRPMECRNP